MTDAANDPTDGGSTQEPIPVSIETIAVLLKGITASVAELGRRVDALEQSHQAEPKEEAKRGTEAGKGNAEGSPDGEDAKPAAPDDHAQATVEDLLSTYVEFRQRVYLDSNGKFEWMSVDAEVPTDEPSQKKPFRYDTHENGKLTFAVFRSARVYEKLLELCPPAHDGQVNLSEDRLEFSDVFPLLHCRKSLEEYGKTLGDTPADDAIRQELRVLEKLYNREGHLLYAQQRYDDLLKNKKIDCESLKGLFHKDQLVVFRELRDEWAVARVTMVTSNDEFNILGGDVSLELECKAIDFDGKNHRAHLYRRSIDVFTGTRNITELPVYPLAYFHDKDRLIKDSVESGARWKALHDRLTTKDGQPRTAVMQYVGYCETFGEDGHDEDGGKGGELASRVIVDPTRFPDRYLQFTEDNEDVFGTESSRFHDKPEDDPLVLCPEKVLVHSLSDNEWYYVAMSKLKEPAWAPNAWARLVKPSSPSSHIAKSIDRVQRLAEAHQKSREKDNSMNNFTGKGKGLTFLLHGPPGVGKTMLAECLSEQQQRPLYRINLGRLVADYRWESTIEEIFRQAHFWDAILLVDEAEVILAERTQENMHQSAWVAVFLRKIEYFEGVIFLTTNLIHMIDPAFISRVNLGFRIPNLDSDTRLEIWKKMLEDLPKSSGAEWLTQKTMREWAAVPLNGRQIRNVIHSARLLASTSMTGKITERDINDSLQDVVGFMDMIDDEKKEVELKYISHWSS